MATKRRSATSDGEGAAKMNGASVRTRIRNTVKTVPRSTLARPALRTARPRPRGRTGRIGQAQPDDSSNGQFEVGTNGAAAAAAGSTAPEEHPVLEALLIGTVDGAVVGEEAEQQATDDAAAAVDADDVQ